MNTTLSELWFKLIRGYQIAIHTLAILAIFCLYMLFTQEKPPALSVHFGNLLYSLAGFGGKVLIVAGVAALIVWEFKVLSSREAEKIEIIKDPEKYPVYHCEYSGNVLPSGPLTDEDKAAIKSLAGTGSIAFWQKAQVYGRAKPDGNRDSDFITFCLNQQSKATAF